MTGDCAALSSSGAELTLPVSGGETFAPFPPAPVVPGTVALFSGGTGAESDCSLKGGKGFVPNSRGSMVSRGVVRGFSL